MRHRKVIALLALILILRPGAAMAADATIVLRQQSTNSVLQIRGSTCHDWRLQTSTALVTWTTATNLGTLLSGGSNAPSRLAATNDPSRTFYRALKTDGLYVLTLLRTISTTFTQANWSNLMVQARTSGTYVYGSALTMDNCATNSGIGARYRENTSFTGGPGGPGSAPSKKSIAIEIDYRATNSDLMGFNSINLNNAFQDETIMRESVYFTMMRPYTV